MKSARIALIGDRSEMVPAHRGIRLSMELAAAALGCAIEPVWIGAAEVTERYNCNFGLNPKFAASLQDQQLKFTAFDANGEIRAFELTDYRFYIGTLYQPERAALEGKLHPLISAFVKAAIASAAR